MKITHEYLSNLMENGRKMLKPDWKLWNPKKNDQTNSPALSFSTGSGEDIRLLEPDMDALPSKTFYECAESRTSVRKFNEKPLSQNELSFLLWNTAHIKAQRADWSRRPIPSAGGRHCLKTYLYIERVEGIDKGIYVYLPDSHALRLVCAHTASRKERLNKALYGQDFGCHATFLWTAVPSVMEHRYTTVAHKMIAFEAGHICQNLHLACESINCGCCAISAFYQSSIDMLIGVDGKEEFVIYTAAAGKKKNK